MKTTAIAVLISLLPTMASANETALTKRIEHLEKAIRLQTLTTQAIRQDNYDLACKAQREAHRATHEANVKDVNPQVDIQFAEICTVSRSLAKPNTPSWLTPLNADSNFEPAGFFVEKK